MVQKNQYTYNVPPGPSDYIYNEARRAEFCIRKRIFEFQKGRCNMRILKVQYTFPTQKLGPSGLVVDVVTGPRRDIVGILTV